MTAAGGNYHVGSAAGNYMAMGATADKNGSALAHRTGSRGPNSSALSTHSAAAKIRGSSYTPMPDRGALREQSQNQLQAE